MRNLITNRRGVTAIEYGLIVALISLACIIAFVELGLTLTGTLGTLTNAMASVTG